MDEAMNKVDQALPDLFEALIERAKGVKDENGNWVVAPDREACICLIDRKMGRPRQQISTEIQPKVRITPEILDKIDRMTELGAKKVYELPPS